MKRRIDSQDGLQRLIDRHRKVFRTPENINYYSTEDFLAAERKFLKFALLNGESLRVPRTENAISDG